MSTIFFSHGTADRDIAESFKHEIEQVNSKVYLFEHDRQPGHDVADKVQKAIEQADILLVLLTKQSQLSPYVHQEIGFAGGAGKRILPLVEPGTGPHILAMLAGKEHIPFDYSNPYKSLSAAQTYIHNHEMDRLDHEMDRLARERDIAIIGCIILALIVAYSVNTALEQGRSAPSS